MRKRYRNKKSSCGLCNPHQRGWSQRWNAKELFGLKDWEKIKINSTGRQKRQRFYVELPAGEG